MAEAVDVLVTNGKDVGKVACRVMYRLAHHADTLYQGIVAQKLSAEWNTAQAVIKQKRQQVGTFLNGFFLVCCCHVLQFQAHQFAFWLCNVCLSKATTA